MSNSGKKQYLQSYREAYAVEFPYIKKSTLGSSYALCSVCNADFRICYGGKNDIKKHMTSSKHQNKVKIWEKNSNSIASYFSNSCDSLQKSVTTAELLFTNFLIEHNIPISVADHAGQLFRKMFPDSAIAKKYACARTKSSAMINVLASEKGKEIAVQLQQVPFSMGIDGSNDNDSKIHPIVVSYFDRGIGKMETCLLALNPIQDRSTGKNIAETVFKVMDKFNIPLKNCIAFAADNAPVMLGEKNGLVRFLKEKHDQIITIRCSCHLINLAAQKAAAALPPDIEQTVIDIYYYLQKSANRKESLKSFQKLHNTDVRKILKHVSTRWLSLNKCLQRLVEQWQPLLSFFLKEVKKCPVDKKKIEASCKDSKKQFGQKRKAEVENKMLKKMKHESKEYYVEDCEKQMKLYVEAQQEQTNAKKTKIQNRKYVTKEDRIFYFLSSEKNKAYSYFLLYIIPEFEKRNVTLQSAAPHIHKLHNILQELLKSLLLKFVKPAIIKNSELLEIDFKNRVNQKDNADLSIGSLSYNIVTQLKKEDQEEFYNNVRQYYLQACSYIVQKFPLHSDILKNADVANLSKIDQESFDKVRFFINKFPFLLNLCKTELETESDAWNRLQEQFAELQAEDLSELLKEERADLQLQALRKIKNCEGIAKFDSISIILLTILTIPHSNAECERLFSIARKNRTTFRSELSDKTLENLLVVKTKTSSSCYDAKFSDELLSKAKSASFCQLKSSV